MASLKIVSGPTVITLFDRTWLLP